MSAPEDPERTPVPELDESDDVPAAPGSRSSRKLGLWVVSRSAMAQTRDLEEPDETRSELGGSSADRRETPTASEHVTADQGLDSAAALPSPEFATREVASTERRSQLTDGEDDRGEHDHDTFRRGGFPSAIGRFMVRRKLGSGGMAVVYEAHDPELNRRVAVKLVRPTHRTSGSRELHRKRLLREAQAMARLNHPNVITVYEVGELGDQVFVAMEFVEGATLRQWLRAATRTRREILDVFVQCGRGLVAAHEAGLVHRDFKPDNVLVGIEGRARVLDLGLARTVDGPEDDLDPGDSGQAPALDHFSQPITRMGAIVGTPMYMAPEQHLGLEIDARADQFAFCVALYEALYREMPFTGATYEELVAVVVAGSPRPAAKNSDVPSWLRRILVRGLAGDAADRYAGMDHLLDDIAAAQAYEEASSGWAQAQSEGAWAAYLRGDLVEARSKLRAAIERQDSPLARALWWTLGRDPLLWRRDIGNTIYKSAISPDGRNVAVGCSDQCIYLFERDTLAQRVLRGQRDHVHCLAYSPDGKLLAYGAGGGALGVWNLTGEVLTRLPGHASAVWRVKFHPDGRRLISTDASGQIRVWNAESGELLTEIDAHDGAIWGFDIHPDGDLLASASSDGTVRIWSFPGGELLDQLERHDPMDPDGAVVFSGDGRFLAANGAARTIRIWRIEPGHRFTSVATCQGHAGVVTALGFSHTGRWLLSSSHDGTLRLWNADDGSEATTVARGLGQLHDVVVDAGGRYALTTGPDLRLWDLDARAKQLRSAGHDTAVQAVAFAPDGSLIASSGTDGSVHLWDTEGRDRMVLHGHTALVTRLTFSSDGTLLASASYDGTLRLWDAATGAERRQLLGHTSGIYDVAFFPGDQRLASVAYDRTLRLWDATSGAETRSFALDDSPLSLAVRPDGAEIAIGGLRPMIRLFSTVTGASERVVDGVPGVVFGLAYSPDGEVLAIGGDGGSIDLRARDGAITERFPVPGTRVVRVAFDDRNARVGAGYADGIPRVWERGTGRCTEFRGHRGEVSALAFGPGGRLVATGGDDGTVRLWDAFTGRPSWRGAALLRTEEVFTHRGWSHARGLPCEIEPAAWRDAVETRARRIAEIGTTLYVSTMEGTVEVWERQRDVCVRRERVGEVEAMVASGLGCLVLGNGTLRLLTPTGIRWQLDGVHAVNVDGSQILVATSTRIQALDLSGNVLRTQDGTRGITALVRCDQQLVLGFEDGAIETTDGEPQGSTLRFPMEATPSSRVLHLVSGPMRTVIAGYDNGTVGLWGLVDGKRLHRSKLHGPVAQVMLAEGMLLAITELGDVMSLDLDVFRMPYRDLVRNVWDRVPVTWDRGRALVQAPPANHPFSDGELGEG